MWNNLTNVLRAPFQNSPTFAGVSAGASDVDEEQAQAEQNLNRTDADEALHAETAEGHHAPEVFDFDNLPADLARELVFGYDDVDDLLITDPNNDDPFFVMHGDDEDGAEDSWETYA